jgi:hypothetical protein
LRAAAATRRSSRAVASAARAAAIAWRQGARAARSACTSAAACAGLSPAARGSACSSGGCSNRRSANPGGRYSWNAIAVPVTRERRQKLAMHKS